MWYTEKGPERAREGGVGSGKRSEKRSRREVVAARDAGSWESCETAVLERCGAKERTREEERRGSEGEREAVAEDTDSGCD